MSNIIYLYSEYKLQRYQDVYATYINENIRNNRIFSEIYGCFFIKYNLCCVVLRFLKDNCMSVCK